MKYLSMAVALLLGFARAEETELNYKIIEKHTMESPVTLKEYENWQGYLSSVMT